MSQPNEAQSLAVKRAEVEFHNFAALGEPERVISVYEQENTRRRTLLRRHRSFIEPLSLFLEIGCSAGHTSYMLANEFGAEGFALDISADALRHGVALMDRWRLSRAPVRVAGDALHLPFCDNSLRVVLACQMLSQFMDIESVFVEVKRVLAPGGVFIFTEEPLLRLLSLRLYRVPYYDLMKPWERKLFDWGLLGYLVRDVIGAAQEASFGIRQNHTMYLADWRRLAEKHFAAQEYEVFVPERGWGERVVKRLAMLFDPRRAGWGAARLLGGTLTAFCRKAGDPVAAETPLAAFERLLRCPDCHGGFRREENGSLRCQSCAYQAPLEGGVYNLLPSGLRSELYPGDRDDIIDFSQPGHEARLLDGWYELEGVYGNKYRWIGARATALLKRVRPGRQKLRIRGSAHEMAFARRQPVRIEVSVNGLTVGRQELDRPGMFVFEAALPDAEEYKITLDASPTFEAPPDDRLFTLVLNTLRLAPEESDE